MKIQYWSILVLILLSCKRSPSHTAPSGFISELNISSKPFQVIHAEKSRKLGSAIELKRLQYLSDYDIIKLEKSGYLILAHFTGMFFEFEGDTLIDISALSRHTSQVLNIDQSKISDRRDIQCLFQDECKFGYLTGATCRPTPPTLTMVSPTTFSIPEISATTPEICILWKDLEDQKSKSYEIQIKNIFDEVLETLIVKNPELNLNLAPYESPIGLFIINISDDENHEISASEMGITVGNQHYFTPKTCTINTAAKALEMAYYLETNHYYTDATEYYKRATELSDKPVFALLLKHHERRK